MPRAWFVLSTVILGAAALICWFLADWSVSQMYAAEAANAFPFAWLLIAMPSAVICVLMFAAFVANVVDLVAPIWEEKVKRR